jgi:hydrogenase expression/formation protein HypD
VIDVNGKIRKLLDHLLEQASGIGRTVRIMEVCGTHTVAIHRCGLRALLPPNVRLISGPGCPVCVTPAGYIDALLELGRRDDAIIATYGDMVRVPGSTGSLASERALGRNIQVVGSAFDCLKLARDHPEKQVIFAAVGFETTTPPTADILIRAAREKIPNLSALTAHKLVIPAMEALLSSARCAIDAFLCPGHVSVLIGADAYRPIAATYGRPCVIGGFEPLQIVSALDRIVSQIGAGESKVENVYPAVVKSEPLASARTLVDEVFEPGNTEWRALGTIRASGRIIRPAYAAFDSRQRFGIIIPAVPDPPGCRCADVIQGLLDPADCPLFGRRCTPVDPVGPCMVSGEGACQAWYKYHSPE